MSTTIDIRVPGTVRMYISYLLVLLVVCSFCIRRSDLVASGQTTQRGKNFCARL